MKLEMKARDRRRLGVMTRLIQGDMTQAEAAVELGVGVRQIKRIVARYRAEGDAGLLHKGRGRSNRARPEAERKRVLERVKEKYDDYGPTLACEALARDGITAARETLRRWLKQENPQRVEDWSRRGRARRRAMRPRRARLGELVQMDTSIHDWLEGGESCVLISMIDDATGRLWARFYDAEGTENNMRLMKEYIERFGLPEALYTDRGSHFAVAKGSPDAEDSYLGRQALTQIGRALEELGVEHILARSPQAKGRVERSYRTLQDRLVKSLREHGAKTIHAANEYLQNAFVSFWNTRFGVQPANPADAHRRPGAKDLAAILSVHEERVVAPDHTISVGGRKYQIALEQPLGSLRPGSKVILEKRLDGSKKLRVGAGDYLKFQPADLGPSGQLRGRNSGRATPSLRSSPGATKPSEA